jgi:hypothetical protein
VKLRSLDELVPIGLVVIENAGVDFAVSPLGPAHESATVRRFPPKQSTAPSIVRIIEQLEIGSLGVGVGDLGRIESTS